MPTPTKDKQSADTLDYAARLKEAMNESSSDSVQEEKIAPMEDDVARLLREQLALFSGNADAHELHEKTNSSWDTTDFEEESDTRDSPLDDLLDEEVLLAEEALREESEKEESEKYEDDFCDEMEEAVAQEPQKTLVEEPQEFVVEELQDPGEPSA